MVDDVEAAVAFYTEHFGFTMLSDAAPAFADVIRGISACCSADRRARQGGRCQTVVSLARVGGIASI